LGKKPDNKQDNQSKNDIKIWCPDRESFQYVKVCDMNCKKKSRCEAFRDYLEPKLF